MIEKVSKELEKALKEGKKPSDWLMEDFPKELTWADELMEKSVWYCNDCEQESSQLCESNMHETYKSIDVDDLVLAVLELDKEIKEKSLVFVEQLESVPDEYTPVRLKSVYERMLRDEALKQLVTKCEELNKK